MSASYRRTGLSFNRRTSARHAEDEGAIPFSSTTTLTNRDIGRVEVAIPFASAGQRSGHLSVKQGIAGSNPVGGAKITRALEVRICPIGPVVKMAVFQAVEEGSIPSWDTKCTNSQSLCPFSDRGSTRFLGTEESRVRVPGWASKRPWPSS